MVCLLGCAPAGAPVGPSSEPPPRTEESWLELGDLVARTEGANGALHVFREAVRSRPESLPLQMSVGLAWQGVATQARNCRGEPLPLCPTSTAKRDASRRALEAYDRAESLQPADPAPPEARANLYLVWGLVEEALGEFEVANERRHLSDEVGKRALGIVMIQMGIGDAEYWRPGGRGFVMTFPETSLAKVRAADRGSLRVERP